MTDDPASLHATAIVVGETGILITGASGSGKSSLARAIIVGAQRAGRFARLVADDRVLLSAVHGRLVARAHPVTAGLLEVRGIGIVREPYEPAAIIGLAVDLDAPFVRYPDDCDKMTTLLGILVPRRAGGHVNDMARFANQLVDQWESNECDIYGRTMTK